MASDFLNVLAGFKPQVNAYDQQQQILQDQQRNQSNANILTQQGQAISAVEQKQQKEQEYASDVQTAIKTGQFGALYAKYPEQQKALQAAHDALDEPAKRVQERDLFAVSSYIKNGSVDAAKKLLQSRVDADKAAGNPADEDQQMLDALNSGDPNQVKSVADMALYAILPADKRAEIFGKQTDKNHVITAGGALVDDTGRELYRAPTEGKTVTVKNADGSETVLQIPGTGGGGQASGGGAPSGSGGAPLSVRLNNPGAIRDNPSNKWVGQVGSENGFAKFDTPENGQRAHRKIIANQIKSGFDTPLSWAQHYAPASDGNDPQAYAARVATGLGIGVNDKIPLGAVPQMASISAAVESGGTPAPSGGQSSGGAGAKVLYTSKPGSVDEPDAASIEYYAQDLANGGSMPTLGSGKTAAKWRQAILKRKAEIQTGKGLDGADNTLRESDVKAARMALGQLMKTQSNVRGFESTFTRNADEALRTAPKGVAGSAPVFNRWIQAGRKSIQGDPDVSAFNVAINTAANEYAKLASGASGGAVTSDSARREAMEILNNAQTLPQLQASIRQMKIDGHNRILGMNEQEARLRSVILGKATGTADAPKGGGAAPTQTATNPKTGQKIGLVNGKWVPIK